MSIKDSLLDFFKLDDDYDDYDDFEEEIDYEKEQRQERKIASRKDAYYDEPKRVSKPRNKVTPINNSKASMNVNIIKPNSFEDSQEICNMLLSTRPVVVNLEGFDTDDAQRIMDFISGCIYSINGTYHQISSYIFIFSPANVHISGDSITIDGNTATMPTINQEF